MSKKRKEKVFQAQIVFLTQQEKNHLFPHTTLSCTMGGAGAGSTGADVVLSANEKMTFDCALVFVMPNSVGIHKIRFKLKTSYLVLADLEHNYISLVGPRTC